MKTAPSIKSLMEIKDLTIDDAKLIRHVWRDAKKSELLFLAEKYGIKLHHGYVECYEYLRQLIIDKIGNFYGLEYLGVHKRSGNEIAYCNAGDAYAATIVFNGLAMRVNCWGDYVEKELIK